MSRRDWAVAALVAVVAYSAGVLLPNPLRRIGASGRVPVIRIPAVASSTFTVRWTDGVDATLTAADLPSARMPQAWLPEGSGIGQRLRISTEIRLEEDESDLRVRVSAPRTR